jgi:hypothetical protein
LVSPVFACIYYNLQSIQVKQEKQYNRGTDGQMHGGTEAQLLGFLVLVDAGLYGALFGFVF